MARLSIRKTIRFKGKQHYAVFEKKPIGKNRVRISGNFTSKEGARERMKKLKDVM